MKLLSSNVIPCGKAGRRISSRSISCTAQGPSSSSPSPSPAPLPHFGRREIFQLGGGLALSLSLAQEASAAPEAAKADLEKFTPMEALKASPFLLIYSSPPVSNPAYIHVLYFTPVVSAECGA
jgi:hypothetical protein